MGHYLAPEVYRRYYASPSIAAKHRSYFADEQGRLYYEEKAHKGRYFTYDGKTYSLAKPSGKLAALTFGDFAMLNAIAGIPLPSDCGVAGIPVGEALDETDSALLACLVYMLNQCSSQTDRSGSPYFFHPIYLANHVAGKRAQKVALLHDLLEDTPTTLEDLAKLGLSKEELKALTLLNRKASVYETATLPGYFAYVNHIRKSSSLAWSVKKADLRMNLDLSRIGEPSVIDFERAVKYEAALRGKDKVYLHYLQQDEPTALAKIIKEYLAVHPLPPADKVWDYLADLKSRFPYPELPPVSYILLRGVFIKDLSFYSSLPLQDFLLVLFDEGEYGLAPLESLDQDDLVALKALALSYPQGSLALEKKRLLALLPSLCDKTLNQSA